MVPIRKARPPSAIARLSCRIVEPVAVTDITRRAVSPVGGEGGQSRAIRAPGPPAGELPQAKSSVEAAGLVPFTHGEVDAGGALVACDARHLGQEQAPDAQAARRRPDIQILEEQPGPPGPAGKGRVEHGE